MSNFQTYTPVVDGVPGTAPRIYSAVTTDTLAVLTAVGYLNDIQKLVKNGDVWLINYLDTSVYPDTQVSLQGRFTVVQSGVNFSLVGGGVSNGITAFAGGGQASATQLFAGINRVTTVATAADSVKLPAATPGATVTVINAAAANSMNVFPQTGEFINALAVNTALAVAAGATVTFYCALAGTWNALA